MTLEKFEVLTAAANIISALLIYIIAHYQHQKYKHKMRIEQTRPTTDPTNPEKNQTRTYHPRYSGKRKHTPTPK